MAIAIPEVAAAAGEATAGAGEAGAAGAGGAGAGAGRAGGPKVIPGKAERVSEQRLPGPKKKTAPKQPAQPKARQPRQAKGRQGKPKQPPPSRRERFEKKARQKGKAAAAGAGRDILRARVPGQRNYQPVILAEFLVATLLVAVSPIAKGGDATAQAKGGPSPYSTDTLKQLVAIGGVYFVLALLSGSRKLGRFTAWFGGLVLVGLGLTQYLSGDLQAVFGTFGPSAPAAAQPAAGEQAPAGEQVSQSFISPPPGGQGTITTDTGPQVI